MPPNSSFSPPLALWSPEKQSLCISERGGKKSADLPLMNDMEIWDMGIWVWECRITVWKRATYTAVICGGMNGNIVVGGFIVVVCGNLKTRGPRERENMMDFIFYLMPSFLLLWSTCCVFTNTHTHTHTVAHMLTACLYSCVQFGIKKPDRTRALF